MITNIFNEIDNKGEKINVYCSFLQIYNEKIQDLLKEEVKLFKWLGFYKRWKRKFKY